MKPDIHPDYREVVFQDTSSGTSFITRSTIATSETVAWEDGNEYPLAKVEISAASHPFFTGTMTIVDTAGRVERFEKRYGRRKKRAGEGEGGEEASAEETAAEAPAAEAAAPEPAAEAAAPQASSEEE